MPSRLILVLNQRSTSPVSYTVLYRADVPAARQPYHANAAYVSPFKPISPDTDPDLSALKSGAVVEKSDVITMVDGTTLAQVKTELQARQATYQAAVTAEDDFSRYGTYWNGTAWTAQGA